MPYYELFCLFRADLPRTELFQSVKKTAERLMDADGVITRIDPLASRELAYDIVRKGVRYETAHFIQYRVFAPASNIYNLAQKLKYDNSILRFKFLRRRLEDAVDHTNPFERILPRKNLPKTDPAFSLEQFLQDLHEKEPLGYRYASRETFGETDQLSFEETPNEGLIDDILRTLEKNQKP
ncbi:hypothetical protein GpartN1_g6516.t1 [Galdieria partita]|uniref:30S ribosomal protein S6, chloroplastic n=1 Tax=Galdieria partita TaxID=83374 RepID=A0A9C7UTP3_9RHOD|nr:hypothetical protein GpartN1_g6516.t1 [Galdieria partita]